MIVRLGARGKGGGGGRELSTGSANHMSQPRGGQPHPTLTQRKDASLLMLASTCLRISTTSCYLRDSSVSCPLQRRLTCHVRCQCE